ncbi:hypothetical protein JDV02_002488 [Purpureocillium takamizusanense]|uniref:Uncharacterized protein n=1 Tax=Purpureocillium takamizusanense TaxID=2060973 RepID=A0A9Q8V7H2_9HYPO|nr:uncharacterized protein JDV02_002488 [Purpureocillium takamizusanense]UNI16010.1 hypothetical protein JDV02_002488 [Purpureocillium takamizusanense]
MQFIYLPPQGPNELVLGYTYAYVVKSGSRVPRPAPTPDLSLARKKQLPRKPASVQEAALPSNGEEHSRAQQTQGASSASSSSLDQRSNVDDAWLDFRGLAPTKPTCTGQAWSTQGQSPAPPTWGPLPPSSRSPQGSLDGSFVTSPTSPRGRWSDQGSSSAASPGSTEDAFFTAPSSVVATGSAAVRPPMPARNSVDDFFCWPYSHRRADQPGPTRASADDAFVTTPDTPGEGSMGYPLGVRWHTSRHAFAPGDIAPRHGWRRQLWAF